MGKETAHEMKQRHKKELKELQELHAKAAKKGAKKDVKDAEKALKEKHEQELLDLQSKSPQKDDSDQEKEKEKEEKGEEAEEDGEGEGGKNEKEDKEDKEEKDEVDPQQLALEEARKEEERVKAKKAKAQQKKQKKEAKEVARREEAKLSASQMADLKGDEIEELKKKLKPQKKDIQEIAADGHCAYRAVAHQIATRGLAGKKVDGEENITTYEGLRQLAARYMSAHKDDFRPFLVDDNGDVLSTEGINRYIKGITAKDPVVWGGQPELIALANALGTTIVVHTAKAPPQAMSPGRDTKHQLHVAYHKHYYGLGEHYNSVVDLPT